MLDELPILEKLKIRKKEIYHQNLKCVCCNLKEENMPHVWSCIMARNDLAEIEREVKETLWNFIGDSNNIKEKDACFEKIYKYTRSEATLKDHNMEESVNYYKNLGYTDMFRTYLWDKQDSLDILLKGWIPKQLMSTIYNYQLKKNIKSIKDIIIKIVGIIERKLYEIWKIRNDIIIERKKKIIIKKKIKEIKKKKNQKKIKEKRIRKIGW